MKNFVENSLVAVCRDETVASYPEAAPFGPGEQFPEYPFPWPAGSTPGNKVYGLVREALRLAGLDSGRYGAPDWNPFGELVSPGDTVLVKPNWVFHHDGRNADPSVLVTNAALIRPLLDYLSIALAGRGRIMVADSPMQSADFDRIVQQSGMAELAGWWQKADPVPLEVFDLRRNRTLATRGDLITGRIELAGDPAGYREVNLGLRSYLAPLDEGCRRYRVTNYVPDEMSRHHNGVAHEYLVAASVLNADLVLNLAKLKTHRKGGITCALKNLVGINGSKDRLPHHRQGPPSAGGDEYRSGNPFKRLVSALGDRLARTGPGLRYRLLWQIRQLAALLATATSSDRISEGSWYGNDTLWRMVLDLNTILVYADREGRLNDRPQRRVFSLVDAVVAGEGDGPLRSEPRPVGLVLAGANPLAVDAVAAALAGLDPHRVPVIDRGFELARGANDLPLANFGLPAVEIASNVPAWQGKTLARPERLEGTLGFRPAAGWEGKIELKAAAGYSPVAGA